jgi:predicted transcriptional regulator of viral defense system
MNPASYKDKAIAIARSRGVVRARDFDAIGIPRVTLRRLVEERILISPSRGHYQLAGVERSAHHSLAEAIAAAPKGVVALLSALQFHGLTTQTPHMVWLLQPASAWVPTNPPVALKIIRATGDVLTKGVERHRIDGVSVPVTNPAKTVADCFKHRSKVGLDVALESLRNVLRTRKASADDLWHFAGIDRVRQVMRPYLEATP